MKFQVTLFLLAALLTATLAITIADIRDDLQLLDTQSRQIGDAIKQLPRRPEEVSAIHIDIVGLGEALNKATSEARDIKGPITESGGLSILAGLRNLKSTTLNTLKDLVAEKGVFIGRGFRDVVLQDLKNLKSSISGFEDSLIAAAPRDLKNQVITVKGDLEDGFDRAIDKW